MRGAGAVATALAVAVATIEAQWVGRLVNRAVSCLIFHNFDPLNVLIHAGNTFASLYSKFDEATVVSPACSPRVLNEPVGRFNTLILFATGVLGASHLDSIEIMIICAPGVEVADSFLLSRLNAHDCYSVIEVCRAGVA